MLKFVLIALSTVFVFGCSSTDDSETEPDEEEFGGCNAIQYVCPDFSYMANDNCTPGEGTCVDTPDEDRCNEGLTCQCRLCYGAEVQDCAGFDNCTTEESCGETLLCVPCADDTCPDGQDVYSECPEGATCTEAMCMETGTTVFCTDPISFY